MEQSDFSTFDVAKKADLLVAEMKKLTPEAEKLWAGLQELYLLSEPMANGAFFVKEGPCEVYEAGCIMSRKGQHSGTYWNSEYCDIQVQAELKLKVESFETESGFDYLTVNGHSFSGSGEGGRYGEEHSTYSGDRPKIQEIDVVSGQIILDTDGSVRRSGWKLCGEPLDKDIPQEERGLQYYPVMYFVDKEFKDVPMTCSGTVVGSPIYFKTYHLCAAACDAAVHDCVGFSYFPTAQDKPNLCFLFSDFKSGQYYSGCDSDKNAAFLQKHNTTKLDQPLDEEPTHPVCVAKLSKFVGTTLKPDPSGKCKECMKELTNAKRCWE